MAEVVNCVLRYCLSAEAISACIRHFAEDREWVPTEFDIRTAANERAWGAGPLTLLRMKAKDCEFCLGSGQEHVTMNKRDPTTGQMKEYGAMAWCRCEFGKARAKVGV